MEPFTDADRSIPEPVGDDAKEVYAFFGLAAYQAQVLEQELLLFASMLRLSRRTGITSRDVEDLLDTLDRRTFGQLLAEARKLTEIPSTLERDLDTALESRNDLVHGFFARHSEDFMSRQGRVEMIAELRAATARFSKVDRAVTALRRPLLAILGITDEMNRRELEQMEQRARQRDGL